ncbi:HpcH/HpaI aldolase/citrate lyase family protein [Halovenus rubra]|uniref:HpcH/HpaI aldolase/citrate lyase family protein n=2 Tax=Halovenus rubra TaxID=869890 RepID=A0ABD5XBY7_9EURY|nr:CoA ester lyase [Halovenus rubra]
MVRRTVLFSPGDQPSLLRNAPDSGADVVVFDLEDAVAPTAKAEARETVAAVVSELDANCELCVRLNPLADGGRQDLEVLGSALSAVDSLMLPKVSSGAAVSRLVDRVDADGTELPILALLETATGVLSAPEISAVDAVDALLLGAEDLSADVGLTRSTDGTEILHARQQVVLAASSENIDAIDTLHTDFEDTEGLTTDTNFAVDLGFDGKMAIHPAQVPVINDAFTPDEDRVEWAQSILNAKQQADKDGRGVFSVDGEMIDAPLIAQARDVLDRASAAGVIEDTE